jgi:hypothetical protein
VRVEEKAIHSPRIGLRSLVQVIERRDFGEVSIVLGPEVIEMRLVLYLSIVDPRNAHRNCKGN